MTRRLLGVNVFDAALDRLERLYADGHRLVVSFSGGKDSGVVLELAILAAQATNRLPVDVVFRDEEVCYPGTAEYVDRVANRPGVNLRWLVANQPIVNLFHREAPYFWVFDPELPASAWVREPPPYAEAIDDLSIEAMVSPRLFPVPDDGTVWLASVIGLRIQESQRRKMAIASSRGYITKPARPYGVRRVRPIYDWTDGDVWRAFHELQWDWNSAYDTFLRLGVPRRELRIGPPTMTTAGVGLLQVAARAWPAWFERVVTRLPGVRLAALYGQRAVRPLRGAGESWETCFRRTCVEDAPAEWIAARASYVARKMQEGHARHATTGLPETVNCMQCGNGPLAAWRRLALALYNGDPFGLRVDTLLPRRAPPGKPWLQRHIDPEFFRPGSGTWSGRPSF